MQVNHAKLLDKSKMSQRVTKESQVPLAPRVMEEKEDHQGRKVLMDQQELQERTERKVRVCLDLLDLLGHKAKQEQLGRKVRF